MPLKSFQKFVSPENKIVTEYRRQQLARGVRETRSNRELTTLIGHQLRSEGLFDRIAKKNEDFRNDFLDIEHEGMGAWYEEMGKGLETGVRGTYGVILGAGALAVQTANDFFQGDVWIDELIRDPLLKAAQEQFQKASENSGTVKRLEDIRNFGEAVAFTSAGFGQAVPSIGEAILTGGVGGVAAKQILRHMTKSALKRGLPKGSKKKFTREQVKDKITVEANALARTIGVTTATLVNSFAISSGEIFTELAADPEIGPDAAKVVSLIFGGINALPDSVLPMLTVNKMFRGIDGITKTQRRAATSYIQKISSKLNERLGTRAFKGLMLGATGEGATEAFQQYMNIMASKFQKGEPAILSDAEISEIKNAAAIGAIGGGGVTTIASLPSSKVSAAIEPRKEVLSLAQEKILRDAPDEEWSREELEAVRWMGQQRGAAMARKATENLVNEGGKQAPTEPLASDDPRNPQVIARAYFRSLKGQQLDDLDVQALEINAEENIVDLTTLGEERELLDSEKAASPIGNVGNITKEAQRLLELLSGEGAVLPETMTAALIRMAGENGIDVTKLNSPIDIIQELKLKQQQSVAATPKTSEAEFNAEEFTHPVINPSAATGEAVVNIPVPPSVETSKPRFSAKALKFDSAIDKALWISNAPNAGADARAFIREVTGMSDEEIAQAREDLKQHIGEAIELKGEKANEQGSFRVSSLYHTNGNTVITNSDEFNFFTEETEPTEAVPIEGGVQVVIQPTPATSGEQFKVRERTSKEGDPIEELENFDGRSQRIDMDDTLNRESVPGAEVDELAPGDVVADNLEALDGPDPELAQVFIVTRVWRNADGTVNHYIVMTVDPVTGEVGDSVRRDPADLLQGVNDPEVTVFLSPTRKAEPSAEAIPRTANSYKVGDKLLFNGQEVVLVEVLTETGELSVRLPNGEESDVLAEDVSLVSRRNESPGGINQEITSTSDSTSQDNPIAMQVDSNFQVFDGIPEGVKAENAVVLDAPLPKTRKGKARPGKLKGKSAKRTNTRNGVIVENTATGEINILPVWKPTKGNVQVKTTKGNQKFSEIESNKSLNILGWIHFPQAVISSPIQFRNKQSFDAATNGKVITQEQRVHVGAINRADFAKFASNRSGIDIEKFDQKLLDKVVRGEELTDDDLRKNPPQVAALREERNAFVSLGNPTSAIQASAFESGEIPDSEIASEARVQPDVDNIVLRTEAEIYNEEAILERLVEVHKLTPEQIDTVVDMIKNDPSEAAVKEVIAANEGGIFDKFFDFIKNSDDGVLFHFDDVAIELEKLTRIRNGRIARGIERDDEGVDAEVGSQTAEKQRGSKTPPPALGAPQSPKSDPVFGVRTTINATSGQTAGSAPTGIKSRSQKAQEAIIVINDAARAAFGAEPINESDPQKAEREYTANFVALVTLNDQGLASIKQSDPDLYDAIIEFRKVVPFLNIGNEGLALSSFSPEILRNMMDDIAMLESQMSRSQSVQGDPIDLDINNALMSQELQDQEQKLKELVTDAAQILGITYVNSETRAQASELADLLEGSSELLEKLFFIGRGSEATVWTAKDKSVVYKVFDAGGAMLGIPVRKADTETGELIPWDIQHLEGHDNTILGKNGMLNQLNITNDIEGYVFTEIIGITNTGQLILKQANLGTESPTNRELVSYLENTHTLLAPKAPPRGSRTNDDALATPFLTRDNQGNWYMHFDVNPRNSAQVGNNIFIYDSVVRKLSPEEMQADPELQEAETIWEFQNGAFPSPWRSDTTPGAVSTVSGDAHTVDYTNGAKKSGQQQLSTPAAIDHHLKAFDNPMLTKSEVVMAQLVEAFPDSSTSTLKAARRMLEILEDAVSEKGNQEALHQLEFIISEERPEGFANLSKQSGGGYNPTTNQLWINPTAHTNPNTWLMTMIHEAGHFFTTYVLGTEVAMQEWQQLTPAQRTKAWADYLNVNGANIKASEINDDGIIGNMEVMHEWSAFLFTRLVTGGEPKINATVSQMKSEGISNAILQPLVDFYHRMKDMFAAMIGDPSLSTADIDDAYRLAMGIGLPQFTAADAVTAFETSEVVVQKVARGDADGRIEFLRRRAESLGLSMPEFVKEAKAFAQANADYRIDNPVASTVLPRAMALPHHVQNTPNPKATSSLHNAMDRPKHTDRDRVQAVLPNIAGAADGAMLLQTAWALNNELQVVENIYKSLASDFPPIAELSFAQFHAKFITTPATPEGAKRFINNQDVAFDKKSLSELQKEDPDRARMVSMQVAREMYENWQYNVTKQRSDRERMLDIDAKIVKLESELQESELELQDAQRKTAQARESLRSDVNQLKTNLNGKGVANRKLGKLGAIIESLEGAVTQPIAAKYVTAINRLIKQATGESLKLFELIEAVVLSEVDIKNLSPRDIAKAFAESDNITLKILAEQDKPTLGALISIVKADTALMNDILTRKIPNLQAKVAMMEERQAQAQGNATEASSRARQNIKEVALQSKLFGRIQSVTSKMRNALSRSKRVKKKLADEIGARNKLIFAFNRMMNESMAALGGTVKGDLIHGSRILDPQNTSASWNDIRATTQEFSLKKGEILPDAQWGAIMTRQREWLADENNKADPWLYNIMETQHRKMMEMAAERVWHDVRSFIDKVYPAPLAANMKRLGTPIGDNMNRMVNKYQTLVETLKNEAGRLGIRSATARQKLIESTGLEAATFDILQSFVDLIDSPAKYHMEQQGATHETLIDFMLTTEAAPLFSTKESQNLLKEYLTHEQNFTTWMRVQTDKLGLKVTDDRIKNLDPTTADEILTSIERLHLNLGTGSFMVRPNVRRIVNMVNAMRPKWGLQETFDNLEIMYSQSEQEGDAALNDLFDDSQGTTRRWFLDALIKKDKTPAFMKRLGNDGVRQFADNDEILDAWQRANGSVSTFMRNLWEMTGDAGETYGDFVNANINEIRQTFYTAIARDAKEAETSEKNKFVPKSVQHTAINARKSDLYPSQWIEYRQSDQRGNVNMAGALAFHAAYGKDGRVWEDNYDAQVTEFVKLTGQLRDVIDRTEAFARANSGTPPKELKKIQEKFASDVTGNSNGKTALRSLQDAEVKLRSLKKNNNAFLSTFQSELGPTKDMGVFQEGLSLLIKGILNGVRAALVQLNQIGQPFLFFGLSGTSFQQAYDQLRFTGQDIVGSFFQAWAGVIDNENAELNLQRELFGADADIGTPFWASLMGDFGVGSELRVDRDDSPGTKARKKAQKLLRVVNGFMGRGWSKASADQALYQSFKPWAPFAMLQGALNRGAMIAMRTSFNRFAMRAINFMQTNPAAIADTEFKFTHKDLNMTRTEFERLNSMLNQDVGISLEQSTRDTIREGRDRPFTNEQYKIISVVGMGILSSEGNFFTTRAAFLKEGTSKVLFPLLGWSIQQPNNFLQAFRDPKTGDTTMKSLSAGVLSVSMGMLPWALGLALFVDWFDEEVMGKKNNKRPLFNKESWKGAVAERVIDSGMLGWWAEGGNLAMNIGQGDLSSVSLDRRVLILSTGRKLISTFGAVTSQGLENSTWASGGRNFWQALGGNGMLQNIDMLSNLLDLDTDETRVVTRINLNNHVRSAGRATGMEMRSFSGQYGTPTRMTPWVTQMILSAYANDRRAFIDSYNNALAQAKVMGKEDPVKAVQLSYQGRHPLRVIFRRKPTPAEWRKALSVMSDGGKTDTLDGIRLYDSFGAIVGVKPLELGGSIKSPSSRRKTSRRSGSDPFGSGGRSRRRTDSLADPFG